MSLGKEAVRRAFQATGGDAEVTGGAAPAFLATDNKDRPVDPMIWADEERMKRELVAWAKVVASMVVTKNTSSLSSSPATRRRV